MVMVQSSLPNLNVHTDVIRISGQAGCKKHYGGGKQNVVQLEELWKTVLGEPPVTAP